ncbi:MAG: ATP-dependent zinc protease [Bacteroidota bacterium]
MAPVPRHPPPPSHIVGWREWVALPDLGLLGVEAKVDTGAEFAVLHAVDLERFRDGGGPHVRFETHPLQGDLRTVVACVAAVVGERAITSSNGQTETRLAIETTLRLGPQIDAPSWPVLVTLTDRRVMQFRLLLGRASLGGRVLVDPAASYLQGRIPDARVLYG